MSSEISRDSDTAGGDIVATSGGAEVYVNGEKIAVHGDDVVPHPPGGIHNSATMVASCNEVYVGGIKACRQGNEATCGHAATGSGGVFLGE